MIIVRTEYRFRTFDAEWFPVTEGPLDVDSDFDTEEEIAARVADHAQDMGARRWSLFRVMTEYENGRPVVQERKRIDHGEV